MKINIPHIHKIEGDAGFWAEVARTGEVKKLKIEAQLGLRQIEGLLVGRKATDVPLVVSRVCGICPVVHILNACCALERALGVRVSDLTVLTRCLLLASQMIHSHTLHIFFMALPDFLDLDNDLDLAKKFPKEARAALQVRDFATSIVEKIGGRIVHPITPSLGGFLKTPDKDALSEILEKSALALENAQFLAKTFADLRYPDFQRETIFASVSDGKGYPFYMESIIKINNEKISVGDFYSNQIEEDLKNPPIKKVKFKGQPYMLGAIARVKNNGELLNSAAKEILSGCSRPGIFQNVFHNLFFQSLEVVHFIEETQKLIREILLRDPEEKPKTVKAKSGSGLSAMEAPRGTIFSYFETDTSGRISDCNIITPTAQFLNNLESDLKIFLPQIMGLPSEKRAKKIRSLIRVYDPCISCATH